MSIWRAFSRATSAAWLWWFAVALVPAIKGQTPDPVSRLLCSVHGQVVQQVGGLPIRKVNIRIAADPDTDETRNDYVGITDVEGHFRIDNLKPGTYRVHFDRTGFVDAEKRRHGNGMLIALQPGEEKDFLFHMLPAAAITGIITDSDGDPEPNAAVAALPLRRTLDWAPERSVSMPNDLGEYRIGGLPPGKYTIQVVASPWFGLRLSANNLKTVPITTYYPGTSEKSQAVSLDVRAGDEVIANIMIAESPHLFRVRGEVSQLPAGFGSASIILRPLDQDIAIHLEPWPLDKSGHFEIRNVLPGSYALLLESGEKAMRADPVLQVSADLDGLRVTPLTNGNIGGKLRMNGDSKVDWTQFGVQLVPTQRRMPSSFIVSGDTAIYWDEQQPNSRVNADGSFDMKDVPPGSYRLTVTASGAALSDYFAATVNLGGRDVSDSGFAAGESTRLDVLISSKGATVEGVVLDDKKQPASDVKVAVFPSDNHRERSDLYRVVATGMEGHFAVRGLPPGEYRVLALDDDIDEDQVNDPEFVRAHLSLGETLEIKEGERKNIVLRLSNPPD